MSETSKAVFLSYASQDAEAAKRICDALRAAGLEVWFDQSELRGGDSWDAKIRRQIKECALFVPIISTNTNARAEGYFRLEWKLAVDRSHLLADDHPFLFPVVIDETAEATARVPDKFRDVQWMRLNVKDTPETLATRVGKLLGGSLEAERPRSAGRGAGAASPKRSHWMRNLGMIMGLTIGLVYALRPLWSPARRPASKPAAVAPPASPEKPLSEARQLTAKARAMSMDKYDSSADDFAAAEGLLKQALALDQNDGEVWAFSSLFNTSMRTRGFDHAPARREMARRDAERALKLAPDSTEALYALGRAQRDFEPEAAEKTFNQLLARQPGDAGTLGNLAWIYDQTGRVDEAAAVYERLATTDPAHAALNRYTEFLLFFHYGRLAEADRCIRQSVAIQPSANSQGGLAMLLLSWKGDADEAARVLATGPTAARNEPRTIWITALVDLCRRAPDHALKTLDRLADDFIQDNWFTGPKAYFAGRAHQLAGRPEAARIAWESALALTNARLKESPGQLGLHLMRGELLAFLGQPDEALREARAVAELARGDDRSERYWFVSPVLIYATLGRADEALPLLEKLCLVPAGQIVGWPLTPALLRVDPIWDKIRDDPRFQKLATSDQPATSVAPALKPDEKSVAVLAFTNLSDDKANEYFSDGISEELLNVLAKVPGLKVTARTSSFHFKGKDTAIKEIAEQLGVAYVIEGSVRKAGNKVRITAQLIKAADGFHLWSDNFDRELKDVFAMQDEIAGLIAKNLRLKLDDAPRPIVRVDPEAYQLYLQGRQALLLRTGAAFDEAEKRFLRAKAIAPDWAPVYAALAETVRLRNFTSGQNRLEGDGVWPPELVRAKALADQALALDPNLPQAYIVLGGILMLRGELPGAERLIRQALELNPNEADAYLVLGRICAALGRMDESIEAFRRGAELNPLAARILDNLAAELNFAGLYDEGWKAISRAAALQPDSSQIQCYQARLLASLGRRDEALQMAETLLHHPDPAERDMRHIEAAAVFARFGRKAEAEAALAQVSPAGQIHAVGLAYVGRPGEALRELDRIEFGWLEDVLWGASFDAVREQPRFVAFLRNAGLVEAQARATAWRVAHGVGPKPKS